MRQPKHTPGPWVVNPETGIDVLTTSGLPVVVQNDSMLEMNQNYLEANAILIAAAPELLEALEYLLSVTLSVPDDVWAEAYNRSKVLKQNVGACDVAREAIDKATGGAE